MNRQMKSPIGDDNEKQIVELIRASSSEGNVVPITLKTDERVIARVTDGIYRRPGSAFRELISNAYDADATRVVIKTDAPRFERITVEDNGHGMSPDVLVYILNHIGGSAKRSIRGQALGVNSVNSAYHSPGGRRLIGKIGIGLFSVSQLTHRFQVITKVKGDRFRTVATIALKQYTDDEHQDFDPGEKRYESAKANIWQEKASDLDSHGTTIVLTNIRAQARDTLRSRDFWDTIKQAEATADPGEVQTIEPPRFHIGRIDSNGESPIKSDYSSLPWKSQDNPKEAFHKLVLAVWDEIGPSGPNPKLERIFDYYLQMVWQLALAVPLPYVEGHIFDIQPKGWATVFELANTKKASAKHVPIPEGQSIRDHFGLIDNTVSSEPFEVLFDDLSLVRPIKFKELPDSQGALKTPLVFIGKQTETFSKIPRELSGGPLKYEAYLFWTPKIAPTEHQGALVRIHGSSGTLFDPTFLQYQIAEVVRLRQITCEIFVHEGLDSALNIDRESFNAAHPHAVYIAKWLHSALKQLASAQKRLASDSRAHARGESKDVTVSSIQQVAIGVWAKESDDPDSNPPQVVLTECEAPTERRIDAYVYERSAVLPKTHKAQTQSQRNRELILEEKLKSITQILASFGFLDTIVKKKQESLLRAIYEILAAPDN